MEAGFYKYDVDVMYSSGSIFTGGYALLPQFKDTYTYPIDGWYWFNTPQEAAQFLGFSYASLLEGEEKTIQEQNETEAMG